MISSQCITWFAVVLTMSVAISNSEPYLLIVLFIKKKRSFPTRAKLYLVMKLTIVDMFVGGFSHSSTYTLLMPHCEISALYLGTDINNWLSLRLVSSDLSYKHCSNFIQSDTCNNSFLYESLCIASLKSESTG